MSKQILNIIKIGGNIIDSPEALNLFLNDFASLEGHKVLIHGGGKLATELSHKLGIQTKLIDGRRITDADTLQIVVMVYAGLINKKLVAALQSLGCNAVGLCGADNNLMQARIRKLHTVDFGFVGDLEASGIHTDAFTGLFQQGITPVIAPITHDGKGQLLNTNADTIASCLARALCTRFDVRLAYCFEKKGVLAAADDEKSVIPTLTERDYMNLKAQGLISKGMLPKLDNAFGAARARVEQVWIGHAADLISYLKNKKNAGTILS